MCVCMNTHTQPQNNKTHQGEGQQVKELAMKASHPSVLPNTHLKLDGGVHL